MSLQHVQAGVLPRHRHAEAYAALVLEGAYEEAGDRGRRRVSAGDVVVHAAWEAHLNRVPRGARVLNLAPLAADLAPFGRVDDPEAIVRLHARDACEAACELAAQFRPAPDTAPDWPDALALDLGRGELSLRAWAADRAISPEHLSRRFRTLYGVTPQRFRLEARARAALAEILAGSRPLAELALLHGFADQAHMSRAVAALTGRSPGQWRRSTAFKTAA